jgi:hypothetical protein
LSVRRTHLYGLSATCFPLWDSDFFNTNRKNRTSTDRTPPRVRPTRTTNLQVANTNLVEARNRLFEINMQSMNENQALINHQVGVKLTR